MNKKIIFLFLGIITVVVVLFTVRLFTPEDTWICSGGQWTKHGNPSAEMPTAICPEGKEVSDATDNQKNFQDANPVGLANPASINCVDKGGELKIEKRPDGGEFGVCYFEDNRQCEEWALYRDECPVGGRKVTGYITEAGRFCAITGGEYNVTDESGPVNEKGTCTLVGGQVCEADAYYNGNCPLAE